MARHANNLDFLLNPGATEEAAGEQKEQREEHDEDSSPSSKIALAFILDGGAPSHHHEALDRELGSNRFRRSTSLLRVTHH